LHDLAGNLFRTTNEDTQMIKNENYYWGITLTAVVLTGAIYGPGAGTVVLGVTLLGYFLAEQQTKGDD
jgi:hypothetical protein